MDAFMYGGRGGGESDRETHRGGLLFDGGNLPGGDDPRGFGCFPDGLRPTADFFRRCHSLRDRDAPLGRSVCHSSFMAEREVFAPSEGRLDHRRYRDRAFIDRGHDVHGFVPGTTHEAGSGGVGGVAPGSEVPARHGF